MIYKKYLKRPIDTALSVTGLGVCSIPMAIISAAIKIDSKGPVIFKQKRLGKGEKTFTIYKFRTMCEGAYEKGGIATRSDDVRITRVGAVLRRMSLDELPQMINIIKGEMAIIGPRPILPCEFDEYRNHNEFEKRFDVRPGLFCSIDIDNRAADRLTQFEYDVNYVENITFVEDARLFFKVIKTVLSGRNVYREEVGKYGSR